MVSDGGETGIRTQATLARRQISNLLRYHSGTSPISFQRTKPGYHQSKRSACPYPADTAVSSAQAGANVILSILRRNFFVVFLIELMWLIHKLRSRLSVLSGSSLFGILNTQVVNIGELLLQHFFNRFNLLESDIGI